MYHPLLQLTPFQETFLQIGAIVVIIVIVGMIRWGKKTNDTPDDL